MHPNPALRRLLRLSWLPGVLVIGLVSTVLALRTPAFEAPDEQHHVNYVNYLLEHQRLPNQLDPEQTVPWQGHQPPLYYSSLALAATIVQFGSTPVDYSLHESPFHVLGGGVSGDVPVFEHVRLSPFASERDRRLFYFLRLLSVLMGAVTIIAVVDTAQSATRRRSVALVIGVLAACIPTLHFSFGTINNDVMTNMFCAIGFAALVRGLRRPRGWRWWIAAGVAIGLGMLSKKTAYFMCPALAGVAIALWLPRRDWRLAISRPLVAGVAALALLSPYLIRTQLVYGDPLGLAMEQTHFTTRHDYDFFSPAFHWHYATEILPRLLDGLVNKLSWLNVELPLNLRLFAAAVALLLAVAGVAGAIRHRAHRGPLLMAAIFVMGCLEAAIYYYAGFAQAQGRYLLPAAAPAALCLALGLLLIQRRLQPRRYLLLAVVLVAAFLALPLASIIYIDRFFYA